MTEFEGWVRGEVEKMGCDGEVYGVYVAEVLRGGEEDAEQRVEAALSGAGADTDAAAAFVKAALQRVEALREEKISQAAAEEQHAAEEVQKLLQQGKTLRAQSQQQPAQEEEEEDLEERRRRQHLLHKYDLPNEMDMDADGKVIKKGTVDSAEDALVGYERNDNAERVKEEELGKRNKQKELSKKQKELAKTSAYDGKKKKEEAKEKRRQKAVKVERRKM